MHESFESPAAIEIWAKTNSHMLTYTRLYAGDLLPTDTKNIDFLIIMGGPQSPATSLTECSYFDAKKEIAFIKNAIDNKKKVLGVCLGAQLIGEAYGAKFEHSPHREVGVFSIHLTEAAKKDPVFSQFPNILSVGHWHGDMPGVPKGAEILAYSEGCPRQVVKYDRFIYGFQCHFEFTKEAIQGMLNHCSSDIAQADIMPYIQDSKTLKSHDYDSINHYLFQFLDYMQSVSN